MQKSESNYTHLNVLPDKMNYDDESDYEYESESSDYCISHELSSLYSACACGYLVEAKRIYEEFPHVLLEDDDHYSFELACEYGRLQVAKWLYDINPPHKIPNDYIHWACMRGDVEMAKWLYQMDPDGLKNQLTLICNMCAKENVIETIQWVYSLIPAEQIDDANKMMNDWFDNACYYGSIKIAQWIYSLNPNVMITSYARNHIKKVVNCSPKERTRVCPLFIGADKMPIVDAWLTSIGK